MNPLAPLIDVIPAKARKYVYALVALLSLGYSIWQAVDGDWAQFIAALIAALTTTTAAANTDVPDDEAPEEPDLSDASYDDLGGKPFDVDPADAESDVPENTPIYTPGERIGEAHGDRQPYETDEEYLARVSGNTNLPNPPVAKRLPDFPV